MKIWLMLKYNNTHLLYVNKNEVITQSVLCILLNNYITPLHAKASAFRRGSRFEGWGNKIQISSPIPCRGCCMSELKDIKQISSQPSEGKLKIKPTREATVI